ncbi:MAG: hypothetical protein QM784_12455 [Polyangiaceae bacterium]
MITHPVRWASLLVVSTGCQKLLGFEEAIAVDATSPIDSPIDDAATDSPLGTFCYGTDPVRPCFETEPTGTLTLTQGFNTDADCPRSMVLDGRVACVVAAQTITFAGGTSRFTGSLPLVLVGTVSIAVNGSSTIDLSSSKIQSRAGAGSDPQDCEQSMVLSQQVGSAGGTFGAKGGTGGSVSGIPGGAPPSVTPISFRGGCAGSSLLGNTGGPGGGAVTLITSALNLGGVVLATGGGGLGGNPGLGGAGGGSGGYIAIDTASITFGPAAQLIAVGGGGGGGGCNGAPGSAGDDATVEILALGGGGGGAGGDGGEGGFDTVGGNGGSSTGACGGGGGGGGAGVIRMFNSIACPQSVCFPPALNR